MKRRIILAAAVLALILVGAAGAAGVTQSDPLISLRYLTETFLPSLLGQAEERLSEAEAVKKSQFEMLERISGFTMEQAKDYLTVRLTHTDGPIHP